MPKFVKVVGLSRRTIMSGLSWHMLSMSSGVTGLSDMMDGGGQRSLERGHHRGNRVSDWGWLSRASYSVTANKIFIR